MTTTLFVLHHQDHLQSWQHAALQDAASHEAITLHLVQIPGRDIYPRNLASQLVHKADLKLFGRQNTALKATPVSQLEAERSQANNLKAIAAGVKNHSDGGQILIVNLSEWKQDLAIAHAVGAPVLTPQLSAHADWRDTPPGLWEALGHEPTIGSRLQVSLPREHSPRVIGLGHSRADDASPLRNQHEAAWRAAAMLHRELVRAATCAPNWGALANDDLNGNRGLPSLWQGLKQVPFHYVARLLASRRNRGLLDQWILLYHRGKAGEVATQLPEFKRILPPRDVFWADPFPVHRDGRDWVFIEEATFEPRRGHLAVIEIDGAGEVIDHQIILKTPYHLSYPNVFNHRGEWYMVPESGADRTIQLYRCTEWPGKWEKVMNLMEGPACYDTTFVEHEGRHWMFVNMQSYDGQGPDDELHLFYADQLLTREWTAHPQNPIVSDVRCARQAGPIVKRDGQMFRPSQHGGGSYGNGTHINRIDTLSTTDFAETRLNTYYPDWCDDITATHHLAESGGLTLADAVYKRPPEV